MKLTTKQIAAAKTDEALFKLLGEELNRLFPPSLREKREDYLAALRAAPRGLRAMAAIYDLDVSMALDDLAWHFANHHDKRLYEETRLGLCELEAGKAADLLERAYTIIAQKCGELGQVLQQIGGGDIHDWLDSTAIQQQIDPLNEEMWRLIRSNEHYGLLAFWLSYARKYPERCVGGDLTTNRKL